MHAADHLAALADHGQLRDGEALQERDRIGDGLLGRDAQERGHVAAARGDELARRGRPRGVVEHAVHEHPVVVEDLREVRPPAVGQDHEQRLLGRHLGGYRQRRVQGHAARGADQDALLARDAARGCERLAVGDAYPAVDHVAVERRRPEVLADALDEIRVHLLARVDRADRVGADDLQAGLALLEIVARARDGAAGADARDEHVELVADLLPDLGARSSRSAPAGSPDCRTGWD